MHILVYNQIDTKSGKRPVQLNFPTGKKSSREMMDSGRYSRPRGRKLSCNSYTYMFYTEYYDYNHTFICRINKSAGMQERMDEKSEPEYVYTVYLDCSPGSFAGFSVII
jgi:hypothetical protein